MRLQDDMYVPVAFLRYVGSDDLIFSLVLSIYLILGTMCIVS